MDLNEFKVFDPLYTGYPTIDINLGGLNRGHFHQFSGRENSGKSTLSQNIIGYIQKNYPDFHFKIYNTEGNFDPEYAKACGMINHNIDIVTENDIKVCLKDALEFIKSNNKNEIPSFVLVDSYAGFTTEEEREKGLDGYTRGVQVRLLNMFIRLAIIPLKKYGSVFLFTNQLRDDQQSQWGGTTTPGGHLLDHILNLHLRLYDLASNSKLIKLNGKVIGHPVSFNVSKLKDMRSYRGFSFILDMIYGEGFSRTFDIINNAVDLNVIDQSGAWYELPGGEKIQGRANLYEKLVNDEELLHLIYSKIT
jgi:recombination protein RecA